MKIAHKVPRTRLMRAIEQIKAVGESVAAVDILPSGGFRVLIGEPLDVAHQDEGGDWLEYVGEEALPRA